MRRDKTPFEMVRLGRAKKLAKELAEALRESGEPSLCIRAAALATDVEIKARGTECEPHDSRF